MIKPYYEDTKAGITIYCGDCREIMPTLGKFDLLLTDPPYGVKRDKGFEGFEGFGGFGTPIARRRFEHDNWDAERPAADTLLAAVNACQLAIVWGGNFFADYLPQGTHWIFWDKLQTMPTFGDGELAWTNSNRKSVSKVVVQWNGLLGKERARYHATQKPLELMTWCIATYAAGFATILDPFMGSGTTLRAAKDLGRRAVGIEIEERYCEIAARRMAQEVLDFGGEKINGKTI